MAYSHRINQSGKSPENRKAKSFRSRKVKAPRSGKITTPRERKVKPPRGRKAKPPRERKVKAPRERKVKPPRSGKVKPPRERKVKAPRERKVKPPRSRKVKMARERKVKPPRTRSVKPPQSGGIKPPRSSSIKSPGSRTGRRYGKRPPFLKNLLAAAAIVVILLLGFAANSRLHLTERIRPYTDAIVSFAENLCAGISEKFGSSESSADGSGPDSELSGGEEKSTEAAEDSENENSTAAEDAEGGSLAATEDTEDGTSAADEAASYHYSVTIDGTEGSSDSSATAGVLTQDEDAAEIWEKTVSNAAAVTDASAFPDLDDSADGTLEMNLLYRYDIDGAFILNYTEKTGYDYMDYFSENDALKKVSTAIHEECHVFMRKNLGWDLLSVYVGNGYSIGVEYTDTYYSQEMIGMIPEELRTLRFDTYVGSPRENLSSNVEGVYGLLNEFNAYCWDNHDIACMFEYYKTLEQTKDTWIAWLNVSNSIGSYAEFRYYILTYLLYARENETAVYQGIMENDSFLVAFQAVDSNFRDVVAQYEANLERTCELLEAAGYGANWDRTTYKFEISQSGTTNILTLSGLEDYDLLMNFMESDADYIAMYKLLWEG